MDATQIQSKAAGETRNGVVDFTGVLPSGITLTGTPTVAELTSSDLTISNVGLGSATREINGTDVVTNKWVFFQVAGGTAGVTYNLRVSAASNETPAESYQQDVRLEVL